MKENRIFLFFYASKVLFSLNLADSDRFEAMILHILQYKFFISQIRHRFGLYDEITCTDGKKTRHCNWIRFLKVKESYGPQVSIIDCLFLEFLIVFFSIHYFVRSQVNIVCTKINGGEVVYEVVKPIPMNQEITVFYIPEKPEEMFFSQIRSTIYRKTMDSILEGMNIILNL